MNLNMMSGVESGVFNQMACQIGAEWELCFQLKNNNHSQSRLHFTFVEVYHDIK